MQKLNLEIFESTLCIKSGSKPIILSLHLQIAGSFYQLHFVFNKPIQGSKIHDILYITSRIVVSHHSTCFQAYFQILYNHDKKISYRSLGIVTKSIYG